MFAKRDYRLFGLTAIAVTGVVYAWGVSLAIAADVATSGATDSAGESDISPDAQLSIDNIELGQRFVVLRKDQRPAWVESPSNWKDKDQFHPLVELQELQAADKTPPAANDAVHTTWVTSDPWKTQFECDEALERKLVDATREYVNWYLGRSEAAQMIGVDLDFVEQQRLVADTYQEDLQFGDSAIGSMSQVHNLLSFDEAFRDRLAQRWKEQVVSARLLQTGLGMACLLGMIAVAFGFLRTDTATRGYYTRRLQWAAGGAILALVASGVLLARWIPWL